MSELNVMAPCGRCAGTGTDDNQRDVLGNVVPEPCTSCGGTGNVVVLTIDITDLEDKIADILNKCNDIFEKVNE